MMERRRTLDGEAATRLILSTFRANGLLLDAGELLSADRQKAVQDLLKQAQKVRGDLQKRAERAVKDLEERGFVQTQDDGSMLVKERLLSLT